MARLGRRGRILRVLAIVVVLVAALGIGGSLYTHGPDTVRIVVKRVWVAVPSGADIPPGGSRIIYDETLSSTSIAQRLQRDLSTLTPQVPMPNDVFVGGCMSESGIIYTYDLTWSRNGITVETASGSSCNNWIEDGFLDRLPSSAHVSNIPAEIAGVVGATR